MHRSFDYFLVIFSLRFVFFSYFYAMYLAVYKDHLNPDSKTTINSLGNTKLSIQIYRYIKYRPVPS